VVALHHAAVSAKDETHRSAAEPRDADVGFVEACCNQQRIMGTFLEANPDCFGVDVNACRRIDKVSEQVARLDSLITVADSLAKIPIDSSFPEKPKAY
jgi:hypothetical protein